MVRSIGDFLFLIVVDAGSVAAAAIVWRFSESTWRQLERLPSPMGLAVWIAALPALVAASWLTLGVTGEIADRLAVGRALWFAMAVGPIIVVLLCVFIEWPLWMQPTHRRALLRPRVRPAGWWDLPVPVVMGASAGATVLLALSAGQWQLAASATLALVVGIFVLARYRVINLYAKQAAAPHDLTPVRDRIQIPTMRHSILFGFGLLLFALGAAMNVVGAFAGVGIAGAILAACCGVLAALCALNLRTSHWVLSRDALTWSGPTGSVAYRWRDVDNFQSVFSAASGDMIAFDFVAHHRPRGWSSVLTAVTQAMLGVDRSLPNNTAVPTADLVQALRAWRRACTSH